MVELQHVFYAEDVHAAAAIMDNARSSGADEIKATLDRKNNVWKVEYRTEDKDERDKTY